jgi:hypothetical protein
MHYIHATGQVERILAAYIQIMKIKLRILYLFNKIQNKSNK